ncbi:noncanonical pyrimidine nucleotidase, YjjG family [Robertkochia marina]|uniref:Noncanonical pyrimidine nucleotidase, YjjG family n=1 Tax=Robertkochia marina TaxID=1227945 RepID=A0A4S3M5A9_9FLAO|nr:YjjG family noncanonical pyrimidine nucleotidase [Robertkochia marina]THD69909.1 noncanonical pyrimidine nucleotidase, YjjG family [Robertkochia marina]TRZ46743.1 noncanonical pyrimidine nucleotidase, YjjG family [Robertkochia marina]
MKDQIEHIFFDLDHTLWDFEKNSALAFKKIFEERELALDLDDFLHVYVPLNLKFWRMFRENRLTKTELRYIRLRSAFDELKYPCNDLLIKEIANDYLTYLPTFNHLFKETGTILSYLDQTYKLHIITNGFANVQEGKLVNSGIDHYFKVVVNSEMAGVKKPNPYIFKLAMKRAGARPERSLMIGDSFEADVLGALNAGMHALYFNPEGETVPGHIQSIGNLLEIKKLL